MAQKDPADPRQMEDEQLKRAFRVAMQDIADDRIVVDGDYEINPEGIRLISIATEAEQELRRRGFDVEEIAMDQLRNANPDDNS